VKKRDGLLIVDSPLGFSVLSAYSAWMITCGSGITVAFGNSTNGEVRSLRERPMLVAPMGRGLCGMRLRFAHDVRAEEEYFSGIPEMKLPVEMLAQHIIQTKAAAFDSAMLEDWTQKGCSTTRQGGRKRRVIIVVPEAALAQR
jgi:hypothetical protein